MVGPAFAVGPCLYGFGTGAEVVHVQQVLWRFARHGLVKRCEALLDVDLVFAVDFQFALLEGVSF